MKVFEKLIYSDSMPKTTNVMWLDATDRAIKFFNGQSWEGSNAEGAEKTSNKVTVIDDTCTDDQYASALAIKKLADSYLTDIIITVD